MNASELKVRAGFPPSVSSREFTRRVLTGKIVDGRAGGLAFRTFDEGALISKGMIHSPQHGDTAFTVPLFDQLMKRTMPELPKPRTPRRK